MCTMLQLITSILVFIASLHVVHAEVHAQCTRHAATTGQLELVCETSNDHTEIKDANWLKDGVDAEVHAQCTRHDAATTDQLELVCETSNDHTEIKDANWFKDGVPISNSTEDGITVDGQGRVWISLKVPSNEGNYSCNSSTRMIDGNCTVTGILA